MIDEKKLIEDIEKEFDGVCVYDVSPSQAIADFIEIVDRQPKVGEWIPCKKELPKTNGVYQVKRIVYEGYFRNYIVTCAYFDGQDTWHNDNRVNHDRPYLKGVIAWTPLQEA